MLHKLVWIVCGVLVLALLAMGGAITVQSIERSGDPVPVVREYLDAIASGDATEANRNLDYTKLEGEQLGPEDGMLLSDDALGAATELITVGNIVTTMRNEDRATVRATLELADETFDHDFELEGISGGFMTSMDWKLVTPLIGMAMTNVRLPVDNFDGSVGLQIGDVATSAPAAGLWNDVRPIAALLYPAIYAVAADGGEYFMPEQGEVRVMPITADSRERLTDIAMSSIFGGVSDPDLELNLAYSERFAEDLTKDGLQFAQLCAAEGGLVAQADGRTISCPPIIAPAVVDVCALDPDLRTGKYDGWSFRCDNFRGVDPFRGEILVEAVSSEATLIEGETTLFQLGPYRFTEAETGRTYEAIFSPAYLDWAEGKPIVKMGDFGSVN